MTKLVVVGGGIAGLAAARRLEVLMPDGEITLVERSERLGGKLLTEQVDGFLVEACRRTASSRASRAVSGSARSSASARGSSAGARSSRARSSAAGMSCIGSRRGSRG